MSKKQQQDEFKIVLEGGKEVNFSDLSDEQKVLVNHIRDIDIKMSRLNFEAQQYQAAKNHFSTELNASFKEGEE